MSNPKSILVVAAHPDDELLGCGGTVARHISEGSIVNTLILAEGSTSRESDEDTVASDKSVKRLRVAATNASLVLNSEEPILLGLPDNKLDSLPLLEIVKKVEEIVKKTSAEVIYTHSRADLNIDHRIAHDATITATRPAVNTCTQSVLAFETLSSTEWGSKPQVGQFTPTRYVDISGFLEIKIEALRSYDTELRQFPHPRSIEAVRALAKLRGSTSGFHAAEAFEVLFERL